MKKPKIKTKPAGTPAVKPAPLADALPANPHAVGLPTIKELATIAATLAQSSKKGFGPKQIDEMDWADELVWAAMKLWITSRKRIIISVLDSEMRREDDNLEKELDPYKHKPFPNEECRSDAIPVSRDIFLRQMLPKYKSRSADLARIAKAYVRDFLRGKSGKEPTHDEISKAYAEWKYVGTCVEANAGAKLFQEWYRQHVTEVRRTAGLKSVAKRIPSRGSK